MTERERNRGEGREHMDGKILFRAGNHRVNFDAVASVEQGSRDRHGPYGIVIVPYVILHMRSPIIREGFPPIWRVEAEGMDASVILQQLEQIAENNAEQMPLAQPSPYEQAMDEGDRAA